MPLSFEPEGGTKYAQTAATVPSIRNILLGTFIALVKPSAYGNAKQLVNTNSNGSGTRNMTIGPTAGANALRGVVNRATTNLTVEVSQVAIPYAALNEWRWWAFVFNTAGAAGAQHIYAATLTDPFVEPTSYITQTAGTGAVTTSATTNGVILGNLAATATSAPVQLALLGIWGEAFSLGELQGFLKNPTASYKHPLAFWRPGRQGVTVVLDESGNGLHATVTGATPTSNKVPILGARRV